MSTLPSPHVRNVVTSHEEPGWNYGYVMSPYFEFDYAREATYLVYNGRLMPISFADSDRFEDYWALRRFGIADVTMGGQRVLVTRTGWTGEIGWEY